MKSDRKLPGKELEVTLFVSLDSAEHDEFKKRIEAIKWFDITMDEGDTLHTKYTASADGGGDMAEKIYESLGLLLDMHEAGHTVKYDKADLKYFQECLAAVADRFQNVLDTIPAGRRPFPPKRKKN